MTTCCHSRGCCGHSPHARRRADLSLRTDRSRAVRARDGRLVVDGWAATRFEAGTTPCTDLASLRATAHLLHARLASAVPERPTELDTRTDQWAVAERLAYDGAAATRAAQDRPERGFADLVDGLVAGLDDTDVGREQLVHADLAGNVLLDVSGTPFVIDLSLAWRSPLWAEAICVLDAVLWLGARPDALDEWRTGVSRQAMLRAALFRVFSDQPCDVGRYAALGLA